VSDSETQHKRTKTCSACGDSGYEYADHTDANGDGKCDDCGATVSLTIKWDAGTNGGTIDGKASFSETVKPNSKPTAPGSVPVKTGYMFKGWFTAKTGGSLYSASRSPSARHLRRSSSAEPSNTVTNGSWVDRSESETNRRRLTGKRNCCCPTEPGNRTKISRIFKVVVYGRKERRRQRSISTWEGKDDTGE